MIIIKEISTNIVAYKLGEDADVELLPDQMIVNKVSILDVNSSTHIKEIDVDDINYYQGGVYAYDRGVWSIGNSSLHDSILPDIKQDKINDLITLSSTSAAEDLTVDGVTFTTDNESVADITTALSVMGRNPNDSIDFRGKSGWALANKASLQGMQNAVWARRKAVNANTKAHEDAITLLTTAQEVLDYDITTGWT